MLKNSYLCKYKNNFKVTLIRHVKVYVVNDPLAINFLVDDDIDGFKEYIDSDDMLDFPEPELFETEQQALVFCAGIGYGPNERTTPEAIRSARARKPMLHSLKPSKIIKPLCQIGKTNILFRKFIFGVSHQKRIVLNC